MTKTNSPLTKLTGHLVEGRAWSKSNKPTSPGWAAYRGPGCDPFMLQIIKDATGLWAQWFTVKGKIASRNIETMNGEWCPVPLPTDAPAQGYYRADDVEALLVKRSAKKVMYPIMQGPSVPWEVMAPHESMAQANHSQSLERLAERGGLSPGEAWCVVNGIRISSGGGRQWDLWSKSWFEYAERVNLHYDRSEEVEALHSDIGNFLDQFTTFADDPNFRPAQALLDRLRGVA